MCQLGCEDGTVKMFEVLAEKVQFQRNFDRQKGERVSASHHQYALNLIYESCNTLLFDLFDMTHVQHVML